MQAVLDLMTAGKLDLSPDFAQVQDREWELRMR